MSGLLSSCEICCGIGHRLPISRADLDRGLAGGCGLCTILYRSISALQRTASASSMPSAETIQCIDYVKITDSSTEASIHIELQGVLNVLDVPKTILLPYCVFLDCATSEIPSSIEKSSLLQDVPTQLTISHVIAYIQHWTTSCNTYHPQCALLNSPELPKRLLDVSSGDGELIKLVEPSIVYAPYVALSYCWGSTGQMLTTTAANLSQHLRSIPWEASPRVFQDAVLICRALNIRYLWIDALAICQDDIVEWELESAKMSDIYSNSYLTIAASSCANSNTSIFSDRWTTVPAAKDTYMRTAVGSIAMEHGGHTFRVRPRLHLAHARFEQLDNARAHLADAPLLTRAWAYQERLLPARTLHFLAEEMVWECKTDLRCECSEIDDSKIKAAEMSPGDEAGHMVHRDFSTNWLKSFFSRVESPTIDPNDLCIIWMDLVSEYSRLDLTLESDRLPALSGLAAKFLNTSLGNYIAGMWSQMLPLGLLYECQWRATDPNLSRPIEHNPQAPSWSWASNHLAGPKGISYDRAINNFRTPCPNFSVKGIRSRVVGKNPFGGVEDALLTVQGNHVKCVALKQGDGTFALRARGMHMLLSKIEVLADLFEDGPYLLTNNTKLVFLHLGSGLGLALRRVAGSQEPKYWRRVGIASFPLSSDWGQHVKLSVLHLV